MQGLTFTHSSIYRFHYKRGYDTNYNYHPQRSWGKVMFLQVSVILFTGGVGGWWWVVSQHALQVSSPTTKGGVEGSGQGGVSRPTWGGLQVHSCGRGLQGAPGPHLGGLVSQHALRQTPPDGYCCGWYASYWNAFLFKLDFKKL